MWKEKLVTNVALSKKLDYYGIRKDSHFFWENTVGQKDWTCWRIVEKDNVNTWDKNLEYVPAYMETELMEMAPKETVVLLTDQQKYYAFYKGEAFPIKETRPEAIVEMLVILRGRSAAKQLEGYQAMENKCPHVVSSSEGTAYCNLANTTSENIEKLVKEKEYLIRENETLIKKLKAAKESSDTYQKQVEEARACEDEVQAERDKLKKEIDEVRGKKQRTENKKGSVEVEIRVTSSFLANDLKLRLANAIEQRFHEEMKAIDLEMEMKNKSHETIASQVKRFVRKFKKKVKP